MSDCCTIAMPTRRRHTPTDLCPICGERGREVPIITLKALLVPKALARLAGEDYRFCSALACPVVYSEGTGGQTYGKDDLKVTVGVKEAVASAPVCYCFGHTRATVWDEIERTGQSTAVETISAHVKAGRCGCEVNNPSGHCCLGEVSRTAKQGLERYRSDEGDEIRRELVTAAQGDERR